MSNQILLAYEIDSFRYFWNSSRKFNLKNVPVGHIWKFDLEKTFSLDFELK